MQGATGGSTVALGIRALGWLSMDPVTSIVGLVVVLTPAAWVVARLVHSDGSNGTFLRAHPDLGWPHGVQEDDDVHWHWERESAPRVLQPASAMAAAGRPPVTPMEASPLRLAPVAPRETLGEPDADIIEADVPSVSVAPVRRR